MRCFVFLVCATAQISGAQADFVTSFSAAEGFVTGAANGQTGNFSVPIVAQSPVQIDATAGVLTGPTDGFPRGIFDFGTFDLGALNTGDTITLTAVDYTVTRTATGDIPNAVFGLTTSNNAGNAQNQLGLQLRLDGAGNIFLDGQGFDNDGLTTDTGFNTGDTFDLVTRITRNADGTFTAASTVGAASFDTATGISLSGNAGVIFQSQGPTSGTFSIGGLSAATVTAVPEPGSCVVLLMMGVLVGTRRRKRSV